MRCRLLGTLVDVERRRVGSSKVRVRVLEWKLTGGPEKDTGGPVRPVSGESAL